MALRTHAREMHPSRNMFDWISDSGSKNIMPFQQSLLDIDWEKSPLGPMLEWPVQLRQFLMFVVQDVNPAVICWGDIPTKQAILYNEAFIEIIGDKHPALQGQDAETNFPEFWDKFEKIILAQHETAQTVTENYAFLLLYRHGFLEETYFNWKFVPIIGVDGWIVGSHITVIEVTHEILNQRRESIVRALTKEICGSKNIKDLWQRFAVGIQGAEKDIPLALLYSTSENTKSRSPALDFLNSPKKGTSRGVDSICTLEAKVGVIPPGHKISPETIDIDSDTTSIAAAYKRAYTDRIAFEIPVDEMWQRELEGIQWRGFGMIPHTLVVFPIIPTDSNMVLGLLLVFVNPRRPYDDEYRNFVHLLTQQVTTPQLSAVLLREEVEHRERIARDCEYLARQLSESEKKFRRFASRAPIGLAILTPKGYVLTANQIWRDLTNLEVGSSKLDWGHVLMEGELSIMTNFWAKMMERKEPVVFPTRTLRKWKVSEFDFDGNEQWANTHLLLAIHPDFGENGEVETVMICITDVSGLKWSELQLRRRMDQAIELKKQQERFIDMTSHEMRNPLSALIGCADEIISNLHEVLLFSGIESPPILDAIPGSASTFPKLSVQDFLNPKHLIDETLEAAYTIIYCAMHQKRIIDDILTLSRLDSNLLPMCPEPSRPVLLIRSALKMFEAEIKRAAISLEFVEDESLAQLDISWTLLDPSRVVQVLINLVTNAVKFTRSETERKIIITMRASLFAPSEEDINGMRYVGRCTSVLDQTMKLEWGTEELIYLIITVADTGKGLTTHEMKNLFNLFAQASPKTHQIYGGSGLGLFISRQLVEMQGGEIGVASMAGKGSTFQFYIKTRRTLPLIAPTTNNIEVQLTVRKDAIQEACTTGRSVLPRTVTELTQSYQLEAPPETAISNLYNSPLSILVVEDNLVNQRVITKQLRKAGHAVFVANHGEEALKFIRRSEFWAPQHSQSENLENHKTSTNSDMPAPENLNVVLMDLEMPVMDGLSCVRRIRELQRTGQIKAHLPVIAVTANARQDQIMDYLEAGMDDITTKPYRITDMLTQIAQLLIKYPPLSAPIHLLPKS